MIIFGIYLSSSDLWLLGICGAIIMAWLSYRLMLSLQRRTIYNDAAKVFRTTIFGALKGLYPVTSYWQESEYHRFRLSIPIVESAAVEFRRYVPQKVAFDIAVKEYAEYCRKIEYGQQERWEMYAPTRKQLGETEPEPIKEFERIIEHLLSFADKK